MAEVCVIVPVYRVQDYLHRCIDSVLSQTFCNFTLVLVDDGSPDNCGQICDDYALRDGRVHVIHQKNAGLSAARNAGLDWTFAHTDCQWITFIDSDDWVHPEMLERLLQGVSQYHTKISACNYWETNGELPSISPLNLQIEIFSAKQFYLEQYVNATIACGKLYHRSVFLRLRYPVGKVHEDEYVTYRVLFESEKIAVIPLPLYYYFVNNQGITKGSWTPSRLDAWDAYEEQLTFFTELGDSELIHYRYRGYLDNVKVNWSAAQETLPPGTPLLRQMKRRIRYLIKRAWLGGHMDFWIDFDILYEFYPFLTRLYRLGLEIKQKWRKYSG